MAAEWDPREAEFQAQFEALRRHFMQELPERRAALVSAWADCADGGDEASWLRVRDVAHKLSGSAPNYGLEAVGDVARRLDRLLSGRTPCRTRGAAEGTVAQLLAGLDEAIAAA
jgi:HPt (histidine-containing phosphotransfer) domain-containing protein